MDTNTFTLAPTPTPCGEPAGIAAPRSTGLAAHHPTATPRGRALTDRKVALWTCTWHAGPDAGATQPFGVGRHVLGRAPALAVRADDPTLEAHHALLDANADGSLSITQLTGRGDLTIDGASVIHTATVTDGAWVEVGHSLVQFRRVAPRDTQRDTQGDTRAAGGHEPARTNPPARIDGDAVLRAPRATPQCDPVAITAPDEPSAAAPDRSGLVPALCGLAGAGLLALVLHQPMFFVFGVLGAFVAVAGWAAQQVTAHRQRHGARRQYQRQLAATAAARVRARAAHRAYLAASVPTLTDAVTTLVDRDDQLWARRGDRDSLVASAGMTDIVSPIDGEPMRGVSLAVSFAQGARVAIAGAQAAATARALIVQLVAAHGPADLRLVVVTDRADGWTWLADVPHATLPDGSPAVVRDHTLAQVLADLDDHRGVLLFVTDRPSLLATRTSPVRRALADPTRHALMAIAADGAVPHTCTSALHTTSGAGARWHADLRIGGLPAPVRLAAIGERQARRCLAALRGLRDPEDPLAAAAMPRALGLAELLSGLPDAAEIADAWARADRDPTPRALVGVAADGTVDIDLVRDGPHGLIAGTTGAGKSELLRTLVVGMACNSSPQHLALVLVDYKGGATFDACAALPHVVGVVTDLDEHLADRALRSLHAELRRRESLLREHGVSDLTALKTAHPDTIVPRLVVVVDEFAALVAEQPTFLHALVGVAQRGRSLGVHLLLATQRPNGVISDDVRANTNLRLALRLQDTVDALDVVGIAAPATLPRQLPGRAVLRLGADDHVLFQTAHCTVVPGGASAGASGAATASGGDRRNQLELLVGAIVDAAKMHDAPLPTPPWCPPLPAIVRVADLEPDVEPAGLVGAAMVGLVDDPDHQTMTHLTWSPIDGHVLIAGSPGSGVSTGLYLLAQRALADDADVYVIDAQPPAHVSARPALMSDLPLGLVHLDAHPGCGGVVGVYDHERLSRLLRHAVRRARGGAPGDGALGDGGGTAPARIVVVIDGLDSLRRVLDDPALATDADLLDELLACAATSGVSIVAGLERAAAAPSSFLATCATRWVLHLHDPHDAAVLGLRAGLVPPAIPGRVALAGSGLLAQLLLPARACTAMSDRRRAVQIEAVPAIVHSHELPTATVDADISIIPVGLGIDDGAPAWVRLHAGEHMVIVGSARSGRSNALAHLASAWRAAHPHGWLGVARDRRGASCLLIDAADCTDAPASVAALAAERAAHQPVLVVVDDAELVDDHDGTLAALARDGRATIIAAGNADALRVAYGHWTAILRRGRTGLIAGGGSELDGDVLGAVLPRRTPIPPRPGLMWRVDGGSVQLVQAALRTPLRTA